MLARMSSRELTAWMVWERLHGPLGPERFDHLNSLLAATVANAFRDKGKAEPKDYMPRWEAPERPQGVDHGDDQQPDHLDQGP